MTIGLLIFSKDRAMQLDLLLRSIETFLPTSFQSTVLYTYSNDDYQKGYEILKQTYSNTHFFEEENFGEDTEDLIFTNKCSHYSFSTDDMLVFRKPEVDLDKVLPTLVSQVFSLRLGFNTIVQDCHRNINQMPLNIYVEKEHTLEWPINFYRPWDNYGYPMAVDMHVFNREWLLDVVENINFNNSNQLETELQKHRDKITVLSSFKQSIAVNIPCNNMSSYTLSGLKYAYNQEDLNYLFLNDRRINLEPLTKVKWQGCHAENSFEFI